MGQDAILRDNNGRFLPGVQPGGNVVKTTADARNLARRRWDKAAAAARAGLLAGVNQSGVMPSVRDHPVQAWGDLVGHAAELALVTDSARGVADLTRFVGHATGYLAQPGEMRAADVQPGLTATVHVPLEQLADLVTALRAERARRETTDADPHTPTTSGDDVGD